MCIRDRLETFTKRNDRYFFHKLSKKYNAEQALDFFVANFLHNDKKWIGDLARTDGQDIYLAHRKYKDAFGYNFRSECNIVRDYMGNNNLTFDNLFAVVGGQHPPFFKLLLSKRISYETFSVFETLLGFIERWDRQIVEKVVWKEYSKRIKKFLPFQSFNRTSAKLTMKETFTGA